MAGPNKHLAGLPSVPGGLGLPFWVFVIYQTALVQTTLYVLQSRVYSLRRGFQSFFLKKKKFSRGFCGGWITLIPGGAWRRLEVAGAGDV